MACSDGVEKLLEFSGRGRGYHQAVFEGHHEWQPGLGELAAESVLIPVGAVRGDRPEHKPNHH